MAYPYFLTPSRQFRNEFDKGIPCSTIKLVNVQPDSTKLDLRTLAMPTDRTSCHGSGFNIPRTPEIYQTPVISTYNCEKKRDPVWTRIAKRSLKDSYKQTTTTSVSAITMLTSRQADSNLNYVQNGCSVGPELAFSLFYDSPTKDLHVTVIRASNLPVSKWFQGTKSTQYFHVKVRVEPWETEWRATRQVCGTREPVFRETFVVSGLVHHKLRECKVHFVVVDFEEYQHCWTIVGEVSLPMIDLRANQLIKATKRIAPNVPITGLN